MSGRLRGVGIGVGLLVVGLLLWVLFLDVRAFFKYNADSAKARGGIPVKVAESQMEQLTEVIGANSLVNPITTIDLTAPVSAEAKWVKVDIGQLVKRGDILAELSTSLLDPVLRAAEDDLLKIGKDVENSRLNLKRFLALYAKKLIPKVEIEKAEAEMLSARGKYSAAVSALEKARYDVRHAVITSPVAAIVQERQIEVGEMIRVADRIFTLGRIDQVMVVAQVAEEKIGYVHLDQAAEVVFDAFPNHVVSGRVAKIDPTTDPKTRTFAVYILVDNPDLKYKPGLTAYSRIKYQHRALTIPSLAVITNAGETTVFVVENSRARLRHIKLEPAPFGKVAVVEGLKAGEKVVYYGLLKLKDNDLVNLGVLPKK